MNKISKKALAIALCFLIPFEALSIDKTTKHAVDNPSHIATTQSTRTNKTEKNQNEDAHPSRSKKIIKGCLLTASAFFAAFYALNPLKKRVLPSIHNENNSSQDNKSSSSPHSSKPSKKKRITNAGISNNKYEICFCNALLQLLYSNISFRKFIDEINLDDLSKYDFGYEFLANWIHPTAYANVAVYLDCKGDGKISADNTVDAYNKDASKRQALFKRKVKLFRKLFELMDKEDVISQSQIEDFVYVALTAYSGGRDHTLHCYFALLKDVVCLYRQYYDISSPMCIKGIFPADIACYHQKKTPAQLFASNTRVHDYQDLKGVFTPFTDGKRQIVPLCGQFTIFLANASILTFPEDAPNNSPGAGYEFKHTDGKIYVLTAIVTHTPSHAYAFKREADGNWYRYNDSQVSKTSWVEYVKKEIEDRGPDIDCGGFMYTFTEKEVFEQSMREAAQSSDEKDN